MDDPAVAEFHAVVAYQHIGETFGFYLYTAASAPSTLNGRGAESMACLHSGDRIGVGGTELAFLEIPIERVGDQ